MTQFKIKTSAAVTLLAISVISATGCYYDRRDDRDYYERRYDRYDRYNDRRDNGRWDRERWDSNRDRWRQE